MEKKPLLGDNSLHGTTVRIEFATDPYVGQAPGAEKYVKEISGTKSSKFKFSICTLITNMDEYREMHNSFICAGFTDEDCEFLYIDNKTNKYDAFDGLNILINKAQGKYLILCHQDILLEFDKRVDLEQRLEELENQDRSWAIAGNAGGKTGKDWKNLAIRITDPWGENQALGGPFPVPCATLDENFILIKSKTNLGLSRDIGGFDFYGADLCMIARLCGYTTYVIDFHLKHKSPGKIDESFHLAKQRFIAKYSTIIKDQKISTTCAQLFISQSHLKHFIYNANNFLQAKRRISQYYLRRSARRFKAVFTKKH